MSDDDSDLRAQLAKVLDWKEAHAGFDKAVEGLPIRSRGLRAAGLPHSVWELVEHIRIAQRDILSFCLDEHYQELEWPLEYWPTKPVPADGQAWDDSLIAYHRDVDALKAMAVDPAIDLLATVPRGTGQTYLRELLLVADHTSYHVAQIVDVRQALGVWNL